MKKIITTVLMAFLTPMMLQAGGIGVYVPYTLNVEKDGTFTEDDTDYEYDYKYNLEQNQGIGIALATNLGKDSVFGYKFALELTHPQSEHSTVSADKIEMLHTFEFGVVNSEFFKFWLGPRINVGYETYENGSFDRSGMEFGLALASGINLNFGKYFAIAFDLDYKSAAQFGSYNNYTYSGVYVESVTGTTARAGVFLKFGESHSFY